MLSSLPIASFCRFLTLIDRRAINGGQPELEGEAHEAEHWPVLGHSACVTWQPVVVHGEAFDPSEVLPEARGPQHRGDVENAPVLEDGLAAPASRGPRPAPADSRSSALIPKSGPPPWMTSCTDPRPMGVARVKTWWKIAKSSPKAWSVTTRGTLGVGFRPL